MKESSSHPQAPPTSTTDAVEKSQAAESDGYKRAPTSFSQRRLWLLDRLLPSRTVYNLRTTRRLVGELDVDALRRALNEVLRRHEALRTRFAVIDGEPVQEIVPQLLLPLVPEDLGDLTALERESEARRRVEDEAQTDFDLQQGPLFRARLLRLSPTEHWLLLTMHHIVTDVWSHSVLVREISTLYAAFRLGEPSPLPEPRMQYADFATWQRQWLQGETLTRQLDYWRIALADLPVLELPTDRARPAVPSYRGGRVTFAIDAARTLALKGLARAEKATPFMALIAALQVLLSRYSGQDDVAVGAPIAGRRRHELAGLIGFFVNTIVLRGDLSGDPSFRAYLARVRERALAAYANQDLPFDRLVEELAPKREPSRNPLFQVVMAFQNTAPIEWRLPGVEVSDIEGIASATTSFDLSVTVQEVDGILRGRMDYARDLFDAKTIECMAQQWLTLLDHIVLDPDCPVSRLRLMGPVLAEQNTTPASGPGEASLDELLSAQIRRTPDAIAVRENDRALTYAALDRRAAALARELSDAGVVPGERVGVCIERSLEEIVGIVAVVRVGAVYVPLDPWHPPERLAFMLQDADASAVVTTSASQRALAQSMAASQRPVIVLDGGERAPEGALPIPPPAADGETPAYVMYTSGSTGEPKGVVVPHRAVVRLVLNTDYVRIGAGDVIAHLSNPAFDAATFEIWGALLNGACLVVITREAVLSPKELAESFDRHGVTALFLTTALFNLVARDAPRTLTGRTVLFGGEAVDPLRVAAALNDGKPKRLLHVYGPTETTTFATWHEVREVSEERRTIPIGRPIANTEVYVLDRNGELVPPGVPGEIYIGGPGLALGYLGQPERTAERFVPHRLAVASGGRLYRTGDRARYRSDGAIEFLGRLDRQVKIRGHRVEPGEVETALRALPQVRDAIVVVRGDTAETRRLDAYIAVTPAFAPRANDVMRDLRRTLPGYMMPSGIVLLASLPLTANGKVDVAALPDPRKLDKSPVSTRGQVPPRDPLEHLLASIWEQLLGVHDIGVHDSFFDLGGHSLLAAQMMDEVERSCGTAVPLTTLFTESTIAHLAAALRGRVVSSSAVVAVHAEGTRPPLFFLHGDFSGGGFYCHALARELGGDQPFYAVHPHGIGGSPVPDSIEAMAADLIEPIRRVRPHGPYLVGGHCNGAFVAVELARQLLAQGEAVGLILVVDARAPWRQTQVFDIGAPDASSARARRPALADEKPAPGMSENIFARYRRALADYAPERLPVRLAVLRSAETTDLRPSLGWSSIGNVIETQTVPGDHHSSITRHVVETAAQMRGCIDRAIDAAA